jgi:membrane-associated phospholipid phosphatase
MSCATATVRTCWLLVLLRNCSTVSLHTPAGTDAPMSATVGVFVVGVLVASGLVVLGTRRSPAQVPDDADEADRMEHWLVAHVARSPRLRSLVASSDRRVVGGAAVAVSFAVIFIAALAVGVLFDSIDSDRGFARWDEAVAQWGPDHATTATADTLVRLTDLGGTIYLLALMAVVGLVDWLRRRDLGSIAFLLCVGIGVSLINNGLKLLIMRERPPVDHLVGSAGSSFPSGHSAAAAACWMAMALVVSAWVPRRWRPVVFGVAVVVAGVVAASRALLGVHWLTDVIAGLVVGWTWFLVVAIAFGGRHQRLGEPAEEISEVEMSR